jgi:ATP-dependent Clp protease ATP-binding subunit ClpB
VTLYETLTSQLIGQNEVLFEVADLLERAQEGMRYRGQPRASILMLGPTGVGKTECALIACKALYGTPEQWMARFDMSEYMTADSVLNLLGTTQYRGTFEHKTKAMKTGGVILFDEIEKAHSEILNTLLQILSAGRITTGQGEVLDLTDFIILATTNIGSRILMESRDDRWEVVRDRTIRAALQEISPEILNRFDLLAAFNKLKPESMAEITDLHVETVIAIQRELKNQVTVDRSARDHIQKAGFSDIFGARPVRREAMKIISRAIREKRSAPGESVSGTITYNAKTNRISIA